MKLMSPLRSRRAVWIVGDVFGLGVEAQIFLEIVLGNESALHFVSRSISPFAHERDGLAFDQLAERSAICRRRRRRRDE